MHRARREAQAAAERPPCAGEEAPGAAAGGAGSPPAAGRRGGAPAVRLPELQGTAARAPWGATATERSCNAQEEVAAAVSALAAAVPEAGAEGATWRRGGRAAGGGPARPEEVAAPAPATFEPSTSVTRFWQAYTGEAPDRQRQPAWRSPRSQADETRDLRPAMEARRAKVNRLIGTGQLAEAAKVAIRVEVRPHADACVGVKVSLQAMEAQRRELLETRRALEEVLGVSRRNRTTNLLRSLWQEQEGRHTSSWESLDTLEAIPPVSPRQEGG